MATRCKHLNGELMELQEDMHIRLVRNGTADEVGINEFGQLTGYTYKCFDCKRVFLFSSVSSGPQWFRRIAEQL